MKEISKKVIFDVTMFEVNGFRAGIPYYKEHEYVTDFIKTHHADAIRWLRVLKESLDSYVGIYNIDVKELQRYQIYIDNFVDNIYILIRDILLPDNEEKKRMDIQEAYARHFDNMLWKGIKLIKNPELIDYNDFNRKMNIIENDNKLLKEEE